MQIQDFLLMKNNYRQYLAKEMVEMKKKYLQLKNLEEYLKNLMNNT